ncbi:hypothetical protein BWQ96_06270 [Gracilariopsis chorda]|uniref:Uncharacterized protein n=1 Tax=Gracilariopsis chorda TaxID=448386 RepID=A0A2V3IS76_9FLOR|nr:hypothetical protein BWQ96_06270 [Gracilariopsis chorda]|eukprot:PXF43960.1 hypothetical protein BWQ96_06270 [Gracilariopsis chorda]
MPLFHDPPTPAKTPNVTPFKALASPFTASAPFTAPTTPYSSAELTPHQLRLSPTLTPQTSHAPQHLLTSPVFTPVTKPLSVDPVSTPAQPHLLTPKQVRELRRLCRKTANRAQFEDRLIQIRQVASIAAMASSSLHLFDPDNPHSGHALRAWVDSNRADGADWRDERPLSDHAIEELRRWDRLLKAWARVRFDTHNLTDSATPHPSSTVNARHSDEHETPLRPVRLQFERLSVGASPITPHYRTKLVASANAVGASPAICQPAEYSIMPLTSPLTPDERSAPFFHSPRPVAHVSHSPLPATYGTDANAMRSVWSKPPLATTLSRRAELRKPLCEVSINKVGDLINVTVPPSTPHASSSVYARDGVGNVAVRSNNGCMSEQENVFPGAAAKRASMSHASNTAKSWRNALLKSSGSAAQEDGVGAMRVNASVNASVKNVACNVSGARDAVVTTPSRTDLDWRRLRGGDGGATTSSSAVTLTAPKSTALP